MTSPFANIFSLLLLLCPIGYGMFTGGAADKAVKPTVPPAKPATSDLPGLPKRPPTGWVAIPKATPKVGPAAGAKPAYELKRPAITKKPNVDDSRILPALKNEPITLPKDDRGIIRGGSPPKVPEMAGAAVTPKTGMASAAGKAPDKIGGKGTGHMASASGGYGGSGLGGGSGSGGGSSGSSGSGGGSVGGGATHNPAPAPPSGTTTPTPPATPPSGGPPSGPPSGSSPTPKGSVSGGSPSPSGSGTPSPPATKAAGAGAGTGTTISPQEAARRKNLGFDPATKKHRPLEEESAIRTEAATGKTLKRDPNGSGDWIDQDGKIYDAVGPVPSHIAGKVNLTSFFRSIDSHLLKTNLDKVVVDVSGMSQQEKFAIEQYLTNLNPTQQAKILKIGF